MIFVHLSFHHQIKDYDDGYEDGDCGGDNFGYGDDDSFIFDIFAIIMLLFREN